MMCILIPNIISFHNIGCNTRKEKKKPLYNTKNNLIKCIKVQKLSGTKIINWGSSRCPKLINLFKRFELEAKQYI